MISNGTYPVKVEGKCVLGRSKNKDTAFLEFYVTIQSGENKGGKARWTGYFTENTAERTLESLMTCGWKGDDIAEFADGELHGLDTNEVDAVIELEEYENEAGEKRTAPRVAWINRKGGALNTKQAMTPDAAKSFGEQMRALVMKAKENRKASGTEDPTDFPHGANAPAGEAKRAF